VRELSNKSIVRSPWPALKYTFTDTIETMKKGIYLSNEKDKYEIHIFIIKRFAFDRVYRVLLLYSKAVRGRFIRQYPQPGSECGF
jgi:hypothetical protein